MQLYTWAVALSIVLARAVSAVLGSSRTVLTVSKQLPVQRRNFSHTVCLCVNLLVPLFFIFKMYVKAEEMLGISKKKRRDHGCRMGKGKCDRATVLSHQAFKEVHLVCIWHWHSQLLFIFHIHNEISLMTSFTGVTKNYWLKHSFTVRLAKNTKIMHVAKYFSEIVQEAFQCFDKLFSFQKIFVFHMSALFTISCHLLLFTNLSKYFRTRV